MQNILTPLQHKFLNEFFRPEYETKEFYLTGGTALSAFYLYHRRSIDLDLFTLSKDSFQLVERTTQTMSRQLACEYFPIRITPSFKHIDIQSVNERLTLHFALEYSPPIKQPQLFEGIAVSSIEEITVNKICTALGRTELKDLVDLYFLDKAGYIIRDYFALAQTKDGGLTPETLAYTMGLFSVAAIPDFMMKPLTEPELDQFIESTISWLVEQSKPPGLP